MSDIEWAIGGSVLLQYAVIWLVFGVVGMMIGSGKQMGSTAGFWWGLLLGPLGVLIVAVSAGPSVLDRIEARPEAEGWHADPLGRFDGRYFDGKRWTQKVGRIESDGTRLTLEDPL